MATKRLIGYSLAALKDNLRRSGDPLGLRFAYWSGWSSGCGLPGDGARLLLTGRMYQMLPYIQQATSVVPALRGLIGIRGAGVAMAAAQRRFGAPVLRLLGARRRALRHRAERALKGIAGGLAQTGFPPAYRPAWDPYGGTLLHELGLQDEARIHVTGLLEGFRRQGVRDIVTVDPHTTWMLRKAAPEGRAGAVTVKHYLEILADPDNGWRPTPRKGLPQSLVLHDGCVLARELGLSQALRRVAERLGLRLTLPAESGADTTCCGGPVEYAFPELSDRISARRARELTVHGREILVACPICLVNLARHEELLGMHVWDLGELLDDGMHQGEERCR